MLLARWSWLDNVTKIAVTISSTSTLLAILPKELSVAKRIKTHATFATRMAALSVDIDH